MNIQEMKELIKKLSADQKADRPVWKHNQRIWSKMDEKYGPGWYWRWLPDGKTIPQEEVDKRREEYENDLKKFQTESDRNMRSLRITLLLNKYNYLRKKEGERFTHNVPDELACYVPNAMRTIEAELAETREDVAV